MKGACLFFREILIFNLVLRKFFVFTRFIWDRRGTCRNRCALSGIWCFFGLRGFSSYGFGLDQWIEDKRAIIDVMVERPLVFEFAQQRLHRAVRDGRSLIQGVGDLPSRGPSAQA